MVCRFLLCCNLIVCFSRDMSAMTQLEAKEFKRTVQSLIDVKMLIKSKVCEHVE